MNILEYENQIVSDAQQYQAKISRDIWGVPHISGRRDADVAFGLAFAHAEDDIKNIAENMYLYRENIGKVQIKHENYKKINSKITQKTVKKALGKN